MNDSSFKSTKHKLNDKVVEICAACDNIPAIGVAYLDHGESNGQMAIIYGADPLGCRTANLICDAGPLIKQTAIIYANGIKTSSLAMSPIGTIQLTLTCDENIRWKAPKTKSNIWNVTCLLRDHPIPTTPSPPVTTPKPCSTCGNIKTARVKNPSLTEGDGKLIIEYMQNEFGCRVAKIVCSAYDEFSESIIYFNEMKDVPVVSNANGAAVISLVCSDNLRFRADGSRVNIETVTCLARDIIPTVITTPATTKLVTTTPAPTTIVTVPVLTTTEIVPPPCATCENLKTKQIMKLQPNEINGALKLEYSKQPDGCRAVNVVCGDVKEGTIARIYFNEQTALPFISDITGQATVELICGSNSRWRAFESKINVASVSCVVISKQISHFWYNKVKVQ
uniref:C6 domain-containing protein n=1 Tax=Loa loa TaxID=7209 RepID=A0A1I7VRL7_LOALO